MNTITTETEYRGTTLGTSIKPEWKLTEIKVGHIDAATEKAMQFNGVWIPKSLIAGLKWACSEVASIILPVWFVIKNNL